VHQGALRLKPQIQGVQHRQHARPGRPTLRCLQILHHIPAHPGMPGELHLAQPRPSAVPTDQGCQCFGLHEISGVWVGMNIHDGTYEIKTEFRSIYQAETVMKWFYCEFNRIDPQNA